MDDFIQKCFSLIDKFLMKIDEHIIFIILLLLVFLFFLNVFMLLKVLWNSFRIKKLIKEQNAEK